MRTCLVVFSVVFASVLVGVTTATTPPAGASGEATVLAPTVGRVEANGVTLAYASFGPADGETILLIAGSGMQLTGWPPELIADLVGRGYRVVAFDNRDVGLSTKFEDAGWPDFEALFAAMGAGAPLPLPYTIDALAADAVGLLDALGIAQAHLVGVSMGGTIAQLVAADYSDRALSLTSIMAESGNPALPVVADPEALAAIPPLEPGITPEAYVERQVRSFQVIGSPAYPTAEATLRAWARRDVARAFSPAGDARQGAVSLAAHFVDRTAKLRSIAVPTVVVHGAEDPLVPVASGEDTAAKIADAELRIIPGMGHDIPVALVPVIADAIMAAAARATGGS